MPRRTTVYNCSATLEARVTGPLGQDGGVDAEGDAHGRNLHLDEAVELDHGSRYVDEL